MDDVGRLRERVVKLERHFSQANDDVRQIIISADKIEKRGERIGALEFAEEEQQPAMGVVIPAPITRKLQAGE
jgi:DNA recombination protein RmuC